MPIMIMEGENINIGYLKTTPRDLCLLLAMKYPTLVSESSRDSFLPEYCPSVLVS